MMHRLSDLAHALLGISFVVIFPKGDGWGQAGPVKSERKPAFCRMMLSTPEGAKSCAMFHALLCVSASSRKPVAAQRCHAGACTLAWPVDTNEEELVAVLSTCFSAGNKSSDGWRTAKEKGKEFGLDLRELKKAYTELTRLSTRDLATAETMLRLAADAVSYIRLSCILKGYLDGVEEGVTAGSS